MTTSNPRRRPTKLSPETKWEIFLGVTSGDISQADDARKHAVDVSTIIGIRRTVKEAALSRAPGRPAKERNWELEAAQTEIAQLTEAIKAQAIELAIVQGKIPLGLNGPVPARVPADVKELVLKTVEDAVAAGFAHRWATGLWQISDDRVHRWRARRGTLGTLADLAPGGQPLHGLLPNEIDAVLAIAEQWGNSMIDSGGSPRSPARLPGTVRSRHRSVGRPEIPVDKPRLPPTDGSGEIRLDTWDAVQAVDVMSDLI